jgi:hypothetical protein
MLAAGCAAEPPVPTVVAVPIRTAPTLAPGLVGGCDTALLGPVTLRGSASEHDPVWVTTNGQDRVAITWPAGFRAVFAPDLVLFGPDGRPVAQGGATVNLGGGFIGEGADARFVACSVNGRDYLPTH